MTSVLLGIALLLGNAFFVGAQFALITVRRDQLEPLARAGRRAAQVTLAQMRDVSSMLAGSQLGIAACSLGLGATAEPAIAHPLEALFGRLLLPEFMLHPTAFMIALAFVAYAHMVLGEMVPKNLALAEPVNAALILGPPMVLWVRATRPVLFVLAATANGALRLFRVEPRSELAATYSAAELPEVIGESVREGLLGRADQLRLVRALTLQARTAGDLAIPPGELVTLEAGSRVSDLEALVNRTGYSRFPVLSSSGEAGSTLVGYVHAKDLLGLSVEELAGLVPTRLIRPMVQIEANLPLMHTFTALERAGRHIGVVTAGGAMRGLITLEDVLEELVGEIRDATHRDEEG